LEAQQNRAGAAATMGVNASVHAASPDALEEEMEEEMEEGPAAKKRRVAKLSCFLCGASSSILFEGAETPQFDVNPLGFVNHLDAFDGHGAMRATHWGKPPGKDAFDDEEDCCEDIDYASVKEVVRIPGVKTFALPMSQAHLLFFSKHEKYRDLARKIFRKRDVVLRIVRDVGLALSFAAEDIRDDKAVVEAAVEQAGLSLRFASAACKADPAIVAKAVKSHGMALEYAATARRNERSIVAKAVENDGRALKFAGSMHKALSNTQRRVALV